MYFPYIPVGGEELHFRMCLRGEGGGVGFRRVFEDISLS